MNSPKQVKWFQTGWFAIATLILFPPLGLLFLWKNNSWSVARKWQLSVAALFWFFMAGIIGGTTKPASETINQNTISSNSKTPTIGGIVKKQKDKSENTKQKSKFHAERREVAAAPSLIENNKNISSSSESEVNDDLVNVEAGVPWDDTNREYRRIALLNLRKAMVDLIEEKESARKKYGDEHARAKYDWQIKNLRTGIESYERKEREAQRGQP